MKKQALIVIAILAAGAFPATIAAHGDEPEDVAAVVAAALKNPIIVKGSARLTIAHVQRGCHIWSTASGTRATGVKVVLRPGQRLTVINQDLDTHKFVRTAGPKLALGRPMSMNDRVTLTFRAPGTYKLHTRKVEMAGMPEIETTGPDHVLAMLVVVR